LSIDLASCKGFGDRLSPEERFFNWGQQNLYPTLLQREKEVRYPRDLFEKVAENGLFRTGQPGPGTGSLKKEVFALKGLAKGSLDIPFCLSLMVHSGMALKILDTFGSSFQKSRWLQAGLDGKAMFGIANTENSGGTDLKSICSSLTVDNDNNESGVLRVQKSMASNVGNSDLILTSVWKTGKGTEKPRLEVLLLDRSLIRQTPLDETLSGFSCGQTGSLRTDNPVEIHIPSVQIGPDGSGGKILRTMFNLDRLYMAAIVSGILEGTINIAFDFIKQRKSMGQALDQYQYIQDKIIAIYSAKNDLECLLHRILPDETSKPLDLAKFSDELCLAKIHSMDRGLMACVSFYEIFGYRAYENKHPAGKLIRDILAFKFLGGSKEQQKLILFNSLQSQYGSPVEKN